MAPRPAPAVGGNALDRLPVVAKAGLGIVVAALVGLLYFVVFYGDVDSQIAQAVQQEAQLKTRLAAAETSKADYQKDSDEKTRREQTAREQKRILPDDPEMPSFLSAIQGVATISGVNLAGWSPAEQTVEEFYAKVPMKLTLVGKFHQIAKFVNGVSQLDRIINVENIVIKTPKLNGDEITVEVDCLATAFRSVKTGEGPRKAGQQAPQQPPPQAPPPQQPPPQQPPASPPPQAPSQAPAQGAPK